MCFVAFIFGLLFTVVLGQIARNHIQYSRNGRHKICTLPAPFRAGAGAQYLNFEHFRPRPVLCRLGEFRQDSSTNFCVSGSHRNMRMRTDSSAVIILFRWFSASSVECNKSTRVALQTTQIHSAVCISQMHVLSTNCRYLSWCLNCEVRSVLYLNIWY